MISGEWPGSGGRGVRHCLLSGKEVHMPPNIVRRNQQTEANLVSTVLTSGKFFSRDTRYFVIVMMAVVANLVDP